MKCVYCINFVYSAWLVATTYKNKLNTSETMNLYTYNWKDRMKVRRASDISPAKLMPEAVRM